MSESSIPEISVIQSVLEQTLGYQLIGAFIALAVYGITLLQTYLYFNRFHSKDSKGLQSLVFILWLLDTACSALVAHALYVVLVKDWGNVTALTNAPVTFALENGCTVLLTWIVQLFLAHRIWLVSVRHDFITPLLVVIISAGAFGAGLALTSRIFIVNLNVTAIETDHFIHVSKSLAEYPNNPLKLRTQIYQVACIIDQGLAAVADVLITLSLCFHLRKQKDEESGMRRTNNVVNSLMLYFINRGALTSIFQVLALGTYSGLPADQNWMVWHLILGKAYINSLLAILNARTHFQKKLNGHDVTISVSGIRFDDAVSSGGDFGTDVESQDRRNTDKFQSSGVDELKN